MEIKLSRRLAAAESYLPHGAYVADIGCDHGKLAASLIVSGRCERVIAADINPAPLARAAALFDRLGIADKAHTVLSDGFEAIDPNIDAAVIAGMGADNIAGIIEAADWIKNPQKSLVLAPASRHSRLREYLCKSGFRIAAETPVYEFGHCYTVMLTVFCGEVVKPEPGFLEVGLIGEQPLTPDGEKYLLTAINRSEKALDGERRSQAPDEQRIGQLCQTIDYIRRRL